MEGGKSSALCILLLYDGALVGTTLNMLVIVCELFLEKPWAVGEVTPLSTHDEDQEPMRMLAGTGTEVGWKLCNLENHHQSAIYLYCMHAHDCTVQPWLARRELAVPQLRHACRSYHRDASCAVPAVASCSRRA